MVCISDEAAARNDTNIFTRCTMIFTDGDSCQVSIQYTPQYLSVLTDP